MTPVSEIPGRWLGLCRKPPARCASQTGPGNQPESSHTGGPGGGAGRTGILRRGGGAARSAAKTLIHNPQLLWFTLLIGLVLVGFSILQGWLNAVPSSPEWQSFVDSFISEWRFFTDPFLSQWWPGFYPDTAHLLYSLIQTFILTIIIELAAMFCLVLFLSGLVLSFPPEKDHHISAFRGLANAGKHLIPLARWSMVMAFAGTLLFVACQHYLLTRPVVEFLSGVLSQSPFNYIINPNLFNSIFPTGVFGFFNFGVIDNLILSAINAFLFVLTLLVVPGIVIGRKSPREAFFGSFALMRKIRGEFTVCILCLGTIVLAALLTSLLFPIIAGGNIATDYWPPPDSWLIAGLLYTLALFSTAFVAATIGGIASLDLYTWARGRQLPGSARTIREVK